VIAHGATGKGMDKVSSFFVSIRAP